MDVLKNVCVWLYLVCVCVWLYLVCVCVWLYLVSVCVWLYLVCVCVWFYLVCVCVWLYLVFSWEQASEVGSSTLVLYQWKEGCHLVQLKVFNVQGSLVGIVVSDLNLTLNFFFINNSHEDLYQNYKYTCKHTVADV